LALVPTVPVVVPPGGEAVGSIVFEDLSELLASELPLPDILIDDMVYAEGVHMASGHPGCGKSTLAMYWCWAVLGEGGHVVWLDYEGGPRQTVRRLQAIGVTPEQGSRLHYAAFPTDAADHLAAVAQRWPGALVVLDSMSKALAFAGISENANDEVTGWTTKVVKACKDNAMPIVIIDHVTKSGDSPYARGAGAKQADIDVHWRVEKTEDFNREQSGTIHMKNYKDRDACLPFDLYWTVGDGNGKLTFTEAAAPPSDDTTPDPDGTQPAI
jgi:RecA-family ATPase